MSRSIDSTRPLRIPEGRLPEGIELLLLPGFGGTGRLFQHLVPLLPGGLRVRVVQYPTNAESLGDLTLAAADAVGDWPATAILSESMGGLVAIDLCRQLGGLPFAAVFCAAFARSPKPLWIDLGLALPPSVLRWFATHPLAIRLACTGNTGGELLDRVRAVTEGLPIETLRRRLRIIRRSDVRAQLAHLRMPSLYLQASADRLVSRSVSNEFCSLIPGIETSVVPGPHLLLQAAPAECLGIIETFLGGIDTPVSPAARRSSSY